MSFRRLLFTIGLVLITGTSFVFPVVTFAAENKCDCYCSDEGTGATKVPDESTSVTSGKCVELCRASGNAVATCAYTLAQRPQNNVMCFTPDECTSQKGIRTATGTGNPIQPGECKAGMYYCYPDPKNRKEVTLQVPIGGLTVTGDLGEYVSTAYKWMLGVGTTIAIVFMMVAGLRWTLGGANAEQVGKAKKTIQNAVVGLILLMSTYLILFTVNPYLVRLQVPAFPMLKTVALADGSKSCGYLLGAWGSQTYLIKNGAPDDSPYANSKAYTVSTETGGTECGVIGEVTKDPDGKTVADTTCTFDYCKDKGQQCFSRVGKCFSCADFAYKGPASGTMEATPEICAGFEKTVKNSNGSIESIAKCTYYGASVTADIFEAVTGKAYADFLRTPFCSYSFTDCSGKTCASFSNNIEEVCTGSSTQACELSCKWTLKIKGRFDPNSGETSPDIGTCEDAN